MSELELTVDRVVGISNGHVVLNGQLLSKYLSKMIVLKTPILALYMRGVV